jgi:hypothetical protein
LEFLDNSGETEIIPAAVHTVRKAPRILFSQKVTEPFAAYSVHEQASFLPTAAQS